MLRDVKSPVDFPPGYFFLYVFLFVIIVVAGILLIRFFIRKFAKKKTEALVPPSPWEVAYESLAKLKDDNLLAQSRIKEYYIRLSGIVRHYIEDRFDVKAPEMTTEEFFFSLKTAQCLSGAQKDALKEFLNCCDMVKFAKYASNDREIEQSFVSAKRLVDETVDTSS